MKDQLSEKEKMKIKIVLLTALFFVLSLSAFAQSNTMLNTTAPDIRKVDFLNYSYRNSICPGMPKTVKVSDGKFKAGDNDFYIAEGEVVYGDVNMDGQEDAVVQIRCATGTSYRAFDIQVYTLQKGRAKLIARLDSDAVSKDHKKTYPDSIMCCAGENAPKIENGHLIVEALTDGMFLNPENTATFDYQLRRNKFVLSGKPTKTKRMNQ